jgi:hypothetical protein
LSVPAGMVLVPAVSQARETAGRLGVALLEAAKTPVYRQETVKTFTDADGNPTARKTEVGVPAWLVGLLALGAGALMARGLRTGVVQMADWWQVSWDTLDTAGSARFTHHTKTVTVPPGVDPASGLAAVGGQPPWHIAKRYLGRRPVWNSAGSVQGYSQAPVVKVL